ncbi:hypothetical protein D3C87_1503670 [compost metagenome]
MSNRLCQPNAGINLAEMNPPPAMPRLKPQNMLVTSRDFLRSGVYSDSSVVAFGIPAPNPKPVRKRSTSN